VIGILSPGSAGLRGNITGLALLTHDLSAKRLELLTEVVQKKSRMAVLWDADAPGPKIVFDEYVTVAPAMNLQLQSLEVRGPTPNFDAAFQAAAKGRAQALITIRNPLLARYMEQIARGGWLCYVLCGQRF